MRAFVLFKLNRQKEAFERLATVMDVWLFKTIT
jgi:hypothetical protein